MYVNIDLNTHINSMLIWATPSHVNVSLSSIEQQGHKVLIVYAFVNPSRRDAYKSVNGA